MWSHVLDAYVSLTYQKLIFLLLLPILEESIISQILLPAALIGQNIFLRTLGCALLPHTLEFNKQVLSGRNPTLLEGGKKEGGSQRGC